MKGITSMLEPMAPRMVDWSQHGFVQGRQMVANVVHVEAALEESRHDEDAEPVAVLLDIAAAFPSVEWAYMLWALHRLGAPPDVVAAIFRFYDPTNAHILWDGAVSEQTLAVTRGIRQGCPAFGTLWALLRDPVVCRAWHCFPRDGLLAVFADDIAVVLRNVFRDWRRVRGAFDEIRVLTGLALQLGKTVLINFTRRGHVVVKDIACDALPCVASGCGRYLGVWLGPDSTQARWGTLSASFCRGRGRPRRLG